MGGNTNLAGGGRSYASPDKQWSAYERLPFAVRAALANAAFDCAPYPLYLALKRGVSADDLVRQIMGSDGSRIFRERKRIWGDRDFEFYYRWSKTWKDNSWRRGGYR